MPKQAPSASAQPDGSLEPASPTGRSVRGYLTLLTAALVVPVLLFAALVLWRVAEADRSRLENEAADNAQALAVLIDRDLTGIFASLQVLATSAYLQAGDFVGFRLQGDEVLRRLGIVTILSDMSGQQLINVRVPLGQPLPNSKLTVNQRDLESGRPFVTDLRVGQVSGNRLFLAATLVTRGGVPTYILMFSIEIDRLQRLIQEADIGPAYTASIVDRQGVIMARSTRADEFVGKPATDDLQRNTTGRRGSWDGTTADGTAVFGTYVRSNLSDYRAAVGIRYSDLNRPMWQSLTLFVLLGLAITALSVLLGLFFGRRISKPIAALTRQAALLGRGQAVPPVETGLLEANVVGAEIATAAAQLAERERDLREANEEIQRFAYIVSHDLRSPLVNIMGFTTELEALRQDVFDRLASLRRAASEAEAAQEPGAAKDGELGADFDEAIGFIKASIAKMDRLINAILRLSREGRRDFHPERVDMDALISGITKSMAHQAEAAGAVVETTRLPPILSDRLALEQIFSNLVDNALKYLRRDVPGRVTVSGQSGPGGAIVYRVADNGRGIEARDTERVFDLFRRSGVQDRPGEGIGLAHVRTLVRKLGGTIALTSEPGQGSTFTVTLPRRWAGPRQREAA